MRFTKQIFLNVLSGTHPRRGILNNSYLLFSNNIVNITNSLLVIGLVPHKVLTVLQGLIMLSETPTENHV